MTMEVGFWLKPSQFDVMQSYAGKKTDFFLFSYDAQDNSLCGVLHQKEAMLHDK